MAYTRLLTTSQLADATFNLGNIAAMPQVPEDSDTKEEILSYLQIANERFSKYEQLYDYKQELLNDPLMKKNQKKVNFCNFFNATKEILPVFFLIWVVVCIISWCSDNVIITFITWKEILACGIVVSIWYAKKLKKKNIDKQGKNYEILNEINLICGTKPFYDLYIESIPFLGEKYRNSDATRSFYEYLSNGRCNTMMEAKNLYEDELHTRRIENRLKEVEHVAVVAKSLADEAKSIANTALDRANEAMHVASVAKSKASSALRKVESKNE